MDIPTNERSAKMASKRFTLVGVLAMAGAALAREYFQRGIPW